MNFKMVHYNFNVSDLEVSMRFYRENFGLTEVRRIENSNFTIVYVGNDTTPFVLELTWLKHRKEPYALGDNEMHLAFTTDDYDSAHALHEKNGVICFENSEMGIYFVEDPDGYWLEVIPDKN